MTDSPYAPPLLLQAREHIAALLDGFRAATGLPMTYVSALARGGDPKFAQNYRRQDFRLGSYDIVVSRLSALWPEGSPWPDGVPRQAPAEIEPAEMEAFRARLAAANPKETADG